MAESQCSGCPSASSCSAEQRENCGSAQGPQSMLEPANKYSKIKKVIGIVSGKGGVGKSFVTACLASAMKKAGYSTGIMDADITGPSIPKMFGVQGEAYGNAEGMILPLETKEGIRLISINLLMENPEDPVIWRGPVIGGAVKQFWTDVVWGDLDYLMIDMPPGTGDVPLTVFQSLPVDGIIVVTSPQELVQMIVKKAFRMAAMMDIPNWHVRLKPLSAADDWILPGSGFHFKAPKPFWPRQRQIWQRLPEFQRIFRPQNDPGQSGQRAHWPKNS